MRCICVLTRYNVDHDVGVDAPRSYHGNQRGHCAFGWWLVGDDPVPWCHVQSSPALPPAIPSRQPVHLCVFLPTSFQADTHIPHIVMHVYPGVFVVAGTFRSVITLYTMLSAWSQAIRDKEFLVEMRLRNHEPELEEKSNARDDADITIDEIEEGDLAVGGGAVVVGPAPPVDALERHNARHANEDLAF